MFVIFDKNIELISVELLYTSFKWIRRAFSAGEFVFQAPFSEKLFKLFEIGNYVYKKNIKEACIIVSRDVKTTITGDIVLVVNGLNITSILNYRQFTYKGNVTIKSFLNSVINDNFITPKNKNRIHDFFKLKSFDFKNQDKTIEVDAKNQDVYQYITAILEENQIKMKAEFNHSNKTFDFYFSNPQYNNVLFSKEFNNVLEQDYLSDSKNSKNVVYVEDRVYFDEIKGNSRKETSMNSVNNGEDELQNVINFLNDKKDKEYLSTTIDAYSEQFIYMKDWDVGDIVLSQNKQLEINKKQIISEVVEFYDEKGLNLEVDLIDLKELN